MIFCDELFNNSKLYKDSEVQREQILAKGARIFFILRKIFENYHEI